jgi:hypothetical protein
LISPSLDLIGHSFGPLGFRVSAIIRLGIAISPADRFRNRRQDEEQLALIAAEAAIVAGVRRS